MRLRLRESGGERLRACVQGRRMNEIFQIGGRADIPACNMQHKGMERGRQAAFTHATLVSHQSHNLTPKSLHQHWSSERGSEPFLKAVVADHRSFPDGSRIAFLPLFFICGTKARETPARLGERAYEIGVCPLPSKERLPKDEIGGLTFPNDVCNSSTLPQTRFLPPQLVVWSAILRRLSLPPNVSRRQPQPRNRPCGFVH